MKLKSDESQAPLQNAEWELKSQGHLQPNRLGEKATDSKQYMELLEQVP